MGAGVAELSQVVQLNRPKEGRATSFRGTRWGRGQEPVCRGSDGRGPHL